MKRRICFRSLTEWNDSGIASEPLAASETEERRAVLFAAVEKLKNAAERLFLYRFFFEEHSVQEVADELCVSVDYARLIKKRALDHLRQILKGASGDD
jgi:RNA polymerase sigma factor (sigma-70 family)